MFPLKKIVTSRATTTTLSSSGSRTAKTLVGRRSLAYNFARTSSHYQDDFQHQHEWMAAALVGCSTLVIAATSSSSSSTETSSVCHCQSPAPQDLVGFTSTSSATTKRTLTLDNQVYEIEQVLGEGAYGMVYQARRQSDGMAVALKTMPRALTGKTDFEREVAALQLLSKDEGHANVVALYDLHRDDQNYYLVMELIQGGELLDHLIDHGAYSEGLASQFLRQLAEAISFIHNNGLVHSDLKPENLLLSKDKTTLKIADFGCARTHDQSRQNLRLPYEEFALGCSFLHMVALGNQFELEKRLQERPTLVNFRDYDFRTPLHLAASEGHVDICRFLVERGAAINRSDRWGGSPLDDAHRHRHTEVIEYLRSQGATFGTMTQLPRFIQAASEGDLQEVKALLEFGNNKTDLLNQGDYDRRTALHLAAGEGQVEMVKLLCQNGANPNVEDRWGNRPLDDAANAKKNSRRIMKILTQFGAKSNKNSSFGRQLLLAFVDDAKDAVVTDDASSVMYLATQSKQGKHDVDTVSGTIAYWPPEIFADGATPTPASDMWAVGVIMYILLTGSHPFDKNADLTDQEIKQNLIKVGSNKSNPMELMNQLVFDERIEGLSESCVELMRKLMHPDPKERITSEKFLRHPWTQGLTATWTTMGKTHDELKAYWQSKFRAEILKKFAAARPGSNALSEEELAEIFQSLDLKKNGVLDLEEIQTTFRGLGISDNHIQNIFASVDLDGSGAISFDEFRALLSNTRDATDGSGGSLNVDYLQQRFKTHIWNKFLGGAKNGNEPMIVPDKNKLREIFNTIDLERNGVLDPHDIRVFLRSVGERDDVICRVVAALDLDRNGKVTWDDFLVVMGVNE